MHCLYCGETEDAHEETFLCQICYYKKPKASQETETKCSLNCKVCKECLESSIIAQFERHTIMNFKCICGNTIPDEVVQQSLDEKQNARLSRFKRSRMIDEDEDLIWCPYLGCEKEVRRKNKQRKATCEHCGKDACFRCQQLWHEGNCKE